MTFYLGLTIWPKRSIYKKKSVFSACFLALKKNGKMKKKREQCFLDGRKERGVILIITILLTFMTLFLAMPFLTKISGQYRSTNRSFRLMAALNLAEAGIERAIWELNHGTIIDWEGDENSRTMSISSFQASDGTVVGDIAITVSDLQEENPIIFSRGSTSHIGSQDLEKSIRVKLEEIEANSVFDYGAFGDEGMLIRGNAVIDSYDSREGEYGGENVGDNGDVGTNGTHFGDLLLSNNVEVNGEAVVGPGVEPQDVIVTQQLATISGEQSALSEEKIFPPVVPPSVLVPRGDYTVEGGETLMISESGMYSSFLFKTNSKVTITSDVILYVTGEFTMLSNTELEIADGASLAIYLGGTFLQNSNSQIDNISLDPTKVQIYGTPSFDTTLTWESNSSFYGAIYVPDHKVYYNSNSDFYGSIIAKNVEINSNGSIHYDQALSGLRSIYTTVTSTYKIKSWRETGENY